MNPSQMKTCASAIDMIGHTPLVKLDRLFPDSKVNLYAKIEFNNPAGSVKDRPARAMIEGAEAAGLLKKGGHIVEATSGNMGIALAFLATIKGYSITLTMPESMSIERRALLKRLGANIELTPAPEGMKGAIEKAHELANKTNGWMPMQFDNPDNAKGHETTTGPEIWSDTNGLVDVFVAGVGTGGTITGTTRYLRKQKPGIESIAVEPTESPVLSGGTPGPHGVQGIGAGFIPKVLDMAMVSRVQTVSTEDAIFMARKVAITEGLLTGISSGAVLAVLSTLAYDEAYAGKTIVGIIASGGERYLSTKLYEDLMLL